MHGYMLDFQNHELYQLFKSAAEMEGLEFTTIADSKHEKHILRFTSYDPNGIYDYHLPDSRLYGVPYLNGKTFPSVYLNLVKPIVDKAKEALLDESRR